jgi:hypothetical protein
VLVMSVVIGGFTVASYIARTKVVQDLQKERDYRQIERANNEVLKTQLVEVQQEARSKVEQLTAALVRAQDDSTSKDNVIRDLGVKLQEEAKKTLTAEASSRIAEDEVKKRQADVEKIRATLNEEMKKNINLEKDKIVLAEKATQATILANSAMEQSKRVEQELQKMAREIARSETTPSRGPVATVRKEANPPREAVEGLVKATDPASGLVQITLGSDAGLAVGNTLEVFRLNTTNPDRSQYLGRIRIVELKATEAIARPVDKMTNKIRVNDNVASRLTGS